MSNTLEFLIIFTFASYSSIIVAPSEQGVWDIKSEKDVEVFGWFSEFINHVDFTQSLINRNDLNQEQLRFRIATPYCTFKKYYSREMLLERLHNIILFRTHLSLIILLKLKTCCQENFIPKKNLEVWDCEKKLLFPKYCSKTETLDEAARKLILKLNTELPTTTDNKYLSEFESAKAIFQDYEKGFDSEKNRLLYSLTMELLAKCPVDFVSCKKDEIGVLAWIILTSYFTVVKKIDQNEACYEEVNEKSFCYKDVLKYLIHALFRYHVILSDDPEKQIEKIKIFCNEIGMECQEDDDEEENGLTPSTTPSTSPEPPTDTPSTSSTPPLQPAVQPAPTRPSMPTSRAARRAPPSTFEMLTSAVSSIWPW